MKTDGSTTTPPDSWDSAAGAAGSRSGVGITNNRTYMNTTATITGGLGGSETQISYAAKQNNGVVNTALQQRISNLHTRMF